MKKIVLFASISVLSFLVSQTLVSNSYSSQGSYYLQIEGIQGSAVMNGEKGWIQLESVQYNETDLDFKIDSTTEINVEFTDNPKITIIKEVDKSSPAIFDALVSGTHITAGKLVLCKDGQCDTKISLSDIYFLDYKMNSNQDAILETVLVSFQSDTKHDVDTLVIPSWIKNNAKWFGDGTIGQSDFTKGIEFMIKEKIMNIPDLPTASSEVSETKTPDWVKNNAKWWADGQISDQDFVKGIQFLVEKGIIKVN